MSEFWPSDIKDQQRNHHKHDHRRVMTDENSTGPNSATMPLNSFILVDVEPVGTINIGPDKAIDSWNSPLILLCSKI